MEDTFTFHTFILSISSDFWAHPHAKWPSLKPTEAPWRPLTLVCNSTSCRVVQQVRTVWSNWNHSSGETRLWKQVLACDPIDKMAGKDAGNTLQTRAASELVSIAPYPRWQPDIEL